MRKILRNIGIIITLTAVCASFASAAAEFETWYVGAMSGLNLRAEPTTDSDVITTYSPHTPLSIIGTDGDKWWQVYDGTNQGWVYSDYMVGSSDEMASTYTSSTNTGDIGDCLGTFWVTGYTAAPEENGGGTVDCFGQPLESQIGDIVAVDPNVIPLNTTIYIEGVGYRKTHDTGVYGSVIDVLTSCNDESYSVTGHRKVYIVDGYTWE